MFSQRNNPYCEFLQILFSKDIINFNNYQIIFKIFISLYPKLFKKKDHEKDFRLGLRS